MSVGVIIKILVIIITASIVSASAVWYTVSKNSNTGDDDDNDEAAENNNDDLSNDDSDNGTNETQDSNNLTISTSIDDIEIFIQTPAVIEKGSIIAINCSLQNIGNGVVYFEKPELQAGHHNYDLFISPPNGNEIYYTGPRTLGLPINRSLQPGETFWWFDYINTNVGSSWCDYNFPTGIYELSGRYKPHIEGSVFGIKESNKVSLYIKESTVDKQTNISFEDEFITGWALNNYEIDWNDYPNYSYKYYIFLPNLIVWNDTFYKHTWFNDSQHLIPDFAVYSYIYVFMGIQPSSGYHINITRIFIENNTMFVLVNRTYPGEGVLDITTFPDDFVKIPNEELNDFIIEDVVFLESHYST